MTMSTSLKCSLEPLGSHSIFLPAGKDSEAEWEVVSRPSEVRVKGKKQRLVIRDRELVVAVGKEVRTTSLDGHMDVRDGRVGTYKVLASPLLNFEIQSIVLNPTKRLLSVVGNHQIVVLVLPRPGWSNHSGEISCRAIPIDEYEFSAKSSTAITKVLWHPLGQAGESLWILTSDGKLREYDIQNNVDSAQTFSFLANTPSSSRFSAIDPLSRYATSFGFGHKGLGWGELAVYGLMANGDIYVLCPVMPLHTEVRTSWLHRLKAYADVRARENFLAQEWVDNLARQVQVTDHREASSTPSQSKRLSILGRSTRGVSDAETAQSGTKAKDTLIRLHPPHLTSSGGPAPGRHAPVERQGPVVLDPAPEEGDEEDVASDIVVISVGAGGDDAASGSEWKNTNASIRVVGVTWNNGRLDLGLHPQRIEARWTVARSQSPSPSLAVVESIRLNIKPDSFEKNAPQFVLDPLHSDKLYVQHIAGVVAIDMGRWKKTIESDDLPDSHVDELIISRNAPIEALLVTCNISLGYCMLALSSNRLAALEMEYEAVGGMESILSTLKPSATSFRPGEPDRQSLILAKPLQVDRLLASIRPSPSFDNARSALKRLSTANKPIDSVGPEHLRAFGDLISQIQTRIEAVRAASEVIENHLELQIKEYQRQLQLLQSSSTGIARIKNHSISSRVEDLAKSQDSLTQRLDHVISNLSAKYRPQIGPAEREWFDELDKARKKVRGGSGFSLFRGTALESRISNAEDEVYALKAKAEDAKMRSAGRRQEATPPGHDPRQISSLETEARNKAEEIRRLMRRMDQLSLRVEGALEMNNAPTEA